MDTDSKQNVECPDIEDVSAFFDGALHEESPTAQHIRDCAICQAKLAELKKLDAAIKNHVTVPDQEKLIENITREVHRKLETVSTRPLLLPKVFLHMAAAAAICSGILYFAFYGIDESNRSNIVQLGPGEEIDPGQFPYYTGSGNDRLSFPDEENSIPLQYLTPAGFGENEPVFKDSVNKLDQNAPRPVAIQRQVRHVWVVKKPSETRAKLLSLLKQAGISGKKIKVSSDSKKTKLAGSMTKLQLVKLVKACAKAGFELVSPQAPQPEQSTFLGKGTTPVTYSAEFLSAKPDK